MSKNLLIDVFYVTIKNKKARKNKTISALNDNGYHCEKNGREWEVWHKDDHGVVAHYDRLSDIPLSNPV